MPTPLTHRIVRLADQLGELRLRLKEAARFEVAQAVANAVAEATRAWIQDRPNAAPIREAHWEDPWDDYSTNPEWTKPEVGAAAMAPEELPLPVDTAILSGLAAARWSFARTGNPAAAIAIAVSVSLVVLCAGRHFKPLLDVVCAAEDLLAFPKQRS